MKRPRRTYAERRFDLLVELRLLRRTRPARRVLKHVQRELRKLRNVRSMLGDDA